MMQLRHFRLLVLALAATAACDATAHPEEFPRAPDGADSPTPAGNDSTGASTADNPLAASPVQVSRAAGIRRQQREGGLGYHVQERAHVLSADNDQHGLSMRFERSRVVLRKNDREAAVRLTALGRAGAIGAPPPVRDIRRDGARVEYDRGELLEWYVNGPLGLEQGFTIANRPSGNGRVEIEVEVGGGLHPVMSEDGGHIALRRGQDVALAVSELDVQDRDGRTLTSSFEVRDGKIVLAFEDTDAHYPIDVDPLFGSLIDQKTPSDAQSRAQFGREVVSDGARVVIGAHNHGRSTSTANDGFGAAYVFERSNGVWQQTAKLSPGTTAAMRKSKFGLELAISGDVIAVGAPGYNTSRGAVFVFRRSGSQWSQEAMLTVPSGAEYDQFGADVSLSGTRLLVGSPSQTVDGVQDRGLVYVYRNTSGATWTAVNTIKGPADVAFFGSKLAQAGRFVFVGVSRAFGPIGAAFAYRESGADQWQATPEVFDCDETYLGLCGGSLSAGIDPATSNELVAVGEPGAIDEDGDISGAAHMYSFNGSTWSKARLSPGGVGDTQYGTVSLVARQVGSDTRVAVAIGPVPTSPVGTPVRLIERSGSSWTTTVVTTQSSNQDGFGIYHALAFDHLVVGAYGDAQTGGALAGRAYFYSLNKANGTSCAAASECASGNCIDGVCCNTSCGGGVLTDCQACSSARGGKTQGTCTPLAAAAASALTCRASAGVCDPAEVCSTTSLSCPPNVFAAATVQCRPPAAGGCDLAERCTGSAATCPADVIAPNTQVCRPAAGGCDVVERCTGSSVVCPRDTLLGNGATCRAAVDICDATEACNGMSAACPNDAFLPATWPLPCRVTTDLGICDPSEWCTGTSSACPADDNCSN